MKLEGKIAIVTGAGKGIGREAALAIAEEGATVVAVARTQADLDETVKMIEEKGGKAVSLSRDLTDGQQVQSMVDAVVGKYGRIDILVNNAGGYPSEIYDKVKKAGHQDLGMVRGPVGSDHQDQFKNSVPLHQQGSSGNDQARRREYRQRIFQNGKNRFTDGSICSGERRHYHIDQDDCHPDAGVWHQSQCCLPPEL